MTDFDKPISGLPAITSISASDLVTVVRPGDPSGTKNKQVTFSNLTGSIKTLSLTETLSVDGFTTLGSGNTGVKIFYTSGTSPAAGASSNFATPCVMDKVIGIDVLITGVDNNIVKYQEGWIANSVFIIEMISGNSSFGIDIPAGQTNIASRPFRACITYIA